MFTSIKFVITEISKNFLKPYMKWLTESSDTSLEQHDTIGGISAQDWKNVGNDLKKGILTYDRSQTK